MKVTKKFLYRYYSNLDYLLDVLRHRRLYFCHPSEFNDPFDCRPLFSIKYSPQVKNETWRLLFYYMAKFQYPVASEEELKQHAKAAFDKGLHRDRKWLSEVEESLRLIEPLVRVCCFATEARNMMMWAHYAANHQGVALAFRSSFLHDTDSHEFRGKEVNYAPSAIGVDEYVEALRNGLDHGDMLAMAQLIYSTKTKHWRSEEEIRFFAAKERPFLSFSENALGGVIFGDQCKEHLIGHVIEALADWGQCPVLLKASIAGTVHKLWIGRHPTNR